MSRFIKIFKKQLRNQRELMLEGLAQYIHNNPNQCSKAKILYEKLYKYH